MPETPSHPSTALLVMDLQNAIVERFVATAVLDRAAAAAAAARAHGVPVIFVRVAFRPGLPEVSPRNKALRRARGGVGRVRRRRRHGDPPARRPGAGRGRRDEAPGQRVRGQRPRRRAARRRDRRPRPLRDRDERRRPLDPPRRRRTSTSVSRCSRTRAPDPTTRSTACSRRRSSPARRRSSRSRPGRPRRVPPPPAPDGFPSRARARHTMAHARGPRGRAADDRDAPAACPRRAQRRPRPARRAGVGKSALLARAEDGRGRDAGPALRRGRGRSAARVPALHELVRPSLGLIDRSCRPAGGRPARRAGAQLDGVQDRFLVSLGLSACSPRPRTTARSSAVSTTPSGSTVRRPTRSCSRRGVSTPSRSPC